MTASLSSFGIESVRRSAVVPATNTMRACCRETGQAIDDLSPIGNPAVRRSGDRLAAGDDQAKCVTVRSSGCAPARPDTSALSAAARVIEDEHRRFVTPQMTTTLALVRHATTIDVGLRLTGRLPGVHLTAEGRREAAQTARALARLRLTAVVSSPRERAIETARHIADMHGLSVQLDSTLDEIDFGTWSGRTFTSLDDDPTWLQFNHSPASVIVPGGESVAAVAQRAVAGLRDLVAHHPLGRICIVSHCDVIRLALARLLGLPLDHYRRLEIAPASITIVELGRETVLLKTLNALPVTDATRLALTA